MSRTGFAVTVLLTILFSCEDSYVSDCSDCYPEGVPLTQLKILIRNPEYIPFNPKLTLYEGPVENGIIIRQFVSEVSVSYFAFDAILYKDYSATLEFSLDGRRYITTAGACPKVGYDKNSCEEPCYFLYDNVLDLRLRSIK
jgi:hypothetical protein